MNDLNQIYPLLKDKRLKTSLISSENFPLAILNPQLQFEKNYPKNVFIPLIQYLAEKGYKQPYQQCVGTREQIERKNVVSLDMIFNLTRQAWFQRNINKNQLLTNISNKILMNSKIKKKLFHLLIAQYILLQDESTEIKQFKKNISKMANQISSQNLPTDQLFSHPNSIIYLLTMFLKIFKHSLESKGIDKLDQQLGNLKIQQTAAQGAKSKALGSKQQYKYLVKQIVQLFGKRNVSIDEMTQAFGQIKNTILFRANQIREQYHLIEKVPNWEQFVEIVVTRCFESRRKDGKITNMILNEWINEYKNKTINVQSCGQDIKERFLVPVRLQSLATPPTDIKIQIQKEGFAMKKFEPIILTKNF